MITPRTMARLAGQATLAVALVAAGLAIGTARAEDKVVARVDGKDITEADIRMAESEIGPELGRYSEAERRSVLVDYLIETRLFAGEGEKGGLGTGPDFETRLNYYRNRALRDAYIDKAVRDTVTDEAAKAVYDEQVKAIPPQEEVHARHILVEKEEDARTLLEQLKGGADFAALAKEKSKDTGSGANGGDLGFFARGQMVKPFEDAAFALANPGDLSEVVQTQFGFHVIRLEEKRMRPLPTFDQVKDRLMSAMLRSKYQEVATKLRGAANVEFLDEALKKAAEQAEAMRGASPGADAEEGEAGQ